MKMNARTGKISMGYARLSSKETPEMNIIHSCSKCGKSGWSGQLPPGVLDSAVVYLCEQCANEEGLPDE